MSTTPLSQDTQLTLGYPDLTSAQGTPEVQAATDLPRPWNTCHQSASSAVAPNIPEFLTEPRYADFVLYCDHPHTYDEIYFKVHRMIVCPQSDVLAAECDINGLKIEADPWAVARMLSYLYTGQYSDSVASEVPTYALTEATIKKSETGIEGLKRCSISASSDDGLSEPNRQLLANVDVFALAKRFQIAGLAALAVSQFELIISPLTTSTQMDTTKRGEEGEHRYEILGLDKVVRRVYEVTKDPESPLRTSIVKLAHRYRKEICWDDTDAYWCANSKEFIDDFHSSWAHNEAVTNELNSKEIVELEQRVSDQDRELESLREQVRTLSADNSQLQQQNRKFGVSQAQLNEIFSAAKSILHGTATTQCEVTITTQKKRKRDKNGNDMIVYKCTCGHSRVHGPSTQKSSVLDGWI